MIARLAVPLLLVLAAAAQAGEPGLLVTVGEVTDTAAVVWVRGQSWGRVTLRYAPAGGGEEKTVDARVGPASNLTAKIPLGGLAAATRYRYAISQGDESVAGAFVTAPAPWDSSPVRFLWSGDLGGGRSCRHITDGYPIFRAMLQYPADFFVFNGDTTYADLACGGADRVPGYDFVARRLPDFWAKHRYNRSDPGVQALFRALSVHAIWDDHEVRNNFSGQDEPLMPVGRQAFLEYFPILPPAEEPGRLYRKFRWGKLVELFILDTRQYRSPNTEPDGPGKTMLGPAQKRWLIDSVAASDATWKIVVSSVTLSVPVGKADRRDSWSNANVFGFPEEGGTGFAVERDSILRALRERGVRNLVFLACDAHHAELIRHHPTPEWSFHEFIAGPLSASLGQPRPLDMGLNPRSLFATGGVENFGEVSVDQAALTVRIVNLSGQVLFTHTIGPE
ncbi:MAG TPA: alkaline phosphatase D family protein [Methylomirabilota bacterium]|nr:alkaline phosphatase D family protein [Methylomirabilota bacterium]